MDRRFKHVIFILLALTVFLANRKINSVSTERRETYPCSGDFSMKEVTERCVAKLEGIMYSGKSTDLADCSGIFLRVLDVFEEVCPNAEFPKRDKVRGSRALANWYNDYGDLHVVKNPLQSSDLIEIGSVMFYGYKQKRDEDERENLSISDLTKLGTGINHVAIVTSVERIDNELVSYELFHGRSFGKVASVTRSFRLTPWDESWPAYGNAQEPWLAISSTPFGR